MIADVRIRGETKKGTLTSLYTLVKIIFLSAIHFKIDSPQLEVHFLWSTSDCWR